MRVKTHTCCPIYVQLHGLTALCHVFAQASLTVNFIFDLARTYLGPCDPWQFDKVTTLEIQHGFQTQVPEMIYRCTGKSIKYLRCQISVAQGG